MSFCRITGKCRNLPKPNYFPLLPPISPADAKRFCRITGKSYGLPSHHYTPVSLIKVNRRDRCKITNVSKDLAPHHYAPETNYGQKKHVVLVKYKYMVPLLDFKDENQKILTEILAKKVKQAVENELYVYKVDEREFGLVLPAMLEAAVRDGDVRDVMLSKESDKLMIKLNKGKSVSVSLKHFENVETAELFEGEGPREEIIVKREKDEKRKGKPKVKGGLSNIANMFEAKENRYEIEAENEKKIKEAARVKAERMAREKLERLQAEKAQALKLNVNLLQQENELSDLVKPLIESWDWNTLEKESNDGVATKCLKSLPAPIKVEPIKIEAQKLKQVDKAFLEKATGFECASYVGKIVPQKIVEHTVEYKKQMASIDSIIIESLSNVELKLYENSSILPQIEDVVSILQRVNQGIISETVIDEKVCYKITVNGEEKPVPGKIQILQGKEVFVPGMASIINGIESFIEGLTVTMNNQEVFLPGHMITIDSKPTFTPGQIVVSEEKGPEFVPGITVNSSEGVQFVAGEISYHKEAEEHTFVAGKEIDNQFICGQILTINDEPQFVQGQTIATQEGLKFVAGVVDEATNTFIPGQNVITPDGVKFISGQTVTVNGKEKFIPGQNVQNEKKEWVFVAGQTVKNENGEENFIPGKTVVTNEGAKFIPGQYVDDVFVPGISDGAKFKPGVNIDTKEGSKFVEGQIVHTKHGEVFMPGTTTVAENGKIEFQIASTIESVKFSEATPVAMPIDSENMKITEPVITVFGHMVQTAHGVEFYPERIAKEHLPKGKIVPGKMIKQNEETKFIPGIVVDDGFIPGQVVSTDHGDQFVPGQVVETSEGLKFCPGQVIETKNGKKFVPGQTMQTANGPRFVPGQIINTKAGPTFIPGQVICTEDGGEKFVPGQVVDTDEGPRFVPGRVHETPNKVTFVPGHIVQTADGPRFVAPDLKNTDEGEEFSVQSFTVSPEELNLLKPLQNGSNIDSSSEVAVILSVDTGILQQLSEAGMSIGRQVEASAVDYVLESTKEKQTLNKFIKKVKIQEEKAEVIENIFDYLKHMLKKLDTSAVIYRPITLNTIQEVSEEEEEINSEPHISVCNGSTEMVETLANNLTLAIRRAFSSPNLHDHESKTMYEIIAEALMDVGDKFSVEEINHVMESPATMQYLCTEVNKNIVRANVKQKINNLKAFVVENVEFEEQEMDDEDLQQQQVYYSAIVDDFCSMIDNKNMTEAFVTLMKKDKKLFKSVVNAINTNDAHNSSVNISNILQMAVVESIEENASIAIQEMVENSDTEAFMELLARSESLAIALGHSEEAEIIQMMRQYPEEMADLDMESDVFKIVNRMLIIEKLAEHDDECRELVESLTKTPILASKNDKLRTLIRQSGSLSYAPPKIKRVATSKDVPLSLLYSNNQIAIEEFMLKSGQNRYRGAFLIIKPGFQAVVPRENSHDVLTGKVAYTVLDEHGMRYFEPMNVLNALKLKSVQINKFSLYNCDILEDSTSEISSNSNEMGSDEYLYMSYKPSSRKSSLYSKQRKSPLKTKTISINLKNNQQNNEEKKGNLERRLSSNCDERISKYDELGAKYDHLDDLSAFYEKINTKYEHKRTSTISSIYEQCEQQMSKYDELSKKYEHIGSMYDIEPQKTSLKSRYSDLLSKYEDDDDFDTNYDHLNISSLKYAQRSSKYDEKSSKYDHLDSIRTNPVLTCPSLPMYSYLDDLDTQYDYMAGPNFKYEPKVNRLSSKYGYLDEELDADYKASNRSANYDYLGRSVPQYSSKYIELKYDDYDDNDVKYEHSNNPGSKYDAISSKPVEYNSKYDKYDEINEKYAHLTGYSGKNDQNYSKYDDNSSKYDENYRKYDENYRKYDDNVSKYDEKFIKRDQRRSKYDIMYSNYDENDKYAKYEERLSKYDEKFLKNNEKRSKYDEMYKKYEEDDKYSKYEQRLSKYDEKFLKYENKIEKHDNKVDKVSKYEEISSINDDKSSIHVEKVSKQEEKGSKHVEKALKHEEKHLNHEEKVSKQEEKVSKHEEKSLKQDLNFLNYDDESLKHDENCLKQEDSSSQQEVKISKYGPHYSKYDKPKYKKFVSKLSHNDSGSKLSKYEKRSSKYDQNYSKYDTKSSSSRISSKYEQDYSNYDNFDEFDTKYEKPMSKLEEIAARYEHFDDGYSSGKSSKHEKFSSKYDQSYSSYDDYNETSSKYVKPISRLDELSAKYENFDESSYTSNTSSYQPKQINYDFDDDENDKLLSMPMEARIALKASAMQTGKLGGSSTGTRVHKPIVRWK